jgi:hypothetical protein
METTINIHCEIFDRIATLSKSWRISRSELIMMLVREMMNSIPDTELIGKMVRYQEQMGPESWRKLHLQVRMDEYEYLLDLRKLFKMSVSLIVAFALKKYKIMKKTIPDNYQFKNYVVIREVVDNIISWRIYWGYPRTLKHLLPPPEAKASGGLHCASPPT